MHTDTSGEYLKSAVMTASPEKLQLMLYDGALRFGRQARDALVAKNFEVSCEKLIKTQQIVTALEDGLRPEVNPSLCRQMADLYRFIFARLVDANTRHSVSSLDEALQIMEHQRETWLMLMDKLREEASAGVTVQPAAARPDKIESGVGAGFCFQA